MLVPTGGTIAALAQITMKSDTLSPPSTKFSSKVVFFTCESECAYKWEVLLTLPYLLDISQSLVFALLSVNLRRAFFQHFLTPFALACNLANLVKPADDDISMLINFKASVFNICASATEAFGF